MRRALLFCCALAADLGTFAREFAATVPPHDVVMVRMTPVRH